MRRFTEARRYCRETPDELWAVEHESIYTLGHATQAAHLPSPETPGAKIPLCQIDRGGQITYHGPGQLVLYFLLDISRRSIKIRELVSMMENGIITFLHRQGIDSYARSDAPGVYVNDAKIAALGLKIRHGCSYHGLSFNVQMDLSPFQWIHPCGYPNLRVTQLSDLINAPNFNDIKTSLVEIFLTALSDNTPIDWRTPNDREKAG